MPHLHTLFGTTGAYLPMPLLHAVRSRYYGVVSPCATPIRTDRATSSTVGAMWNHAVCGTVEPMWSRANALTSQCGHELIC
eukprot:3485083-Rhodomonas_salina.1